MENCHACRLGGRGRLSLGTVSMRGPMLGQISCQTSLARFPRAHGCLIPNDWAGYSCATFASGYVQYLKLLINSTLPLFQALAVVNIGL